MSLSKLVKYLTKPKEKTHTKLEVFEAAYSACQDAKRWPQPVMLTLYIAEVSGVKSTLEALGYSYEEFYEWSQEKEDRDATGTV